MLATITSKQIKHTISEIKKKLPHEIVTKFDHMKSAGTKCILSTQRVSRTSRMLLPFHIVHNNHLSIAQLQTHVNGTVIQLPFKQYLQIKSKEEHERSELEQYSLTHIGSDDIVSCIITLVKEEGKSSVGVEEETLYKQFEEEKNTHHWTRLSINPMISCKGNKNKGNDKWMGHYYIDMGGGSTKNNETMPPSHTPNEIKSSSFQIFTNWNGFMTNEDVIIDVEASLYYQFLFVKGLETYIEREKIKEYVTIFTNYLSTISYLGETVYHRIHRVVKVNQDQHLLSPITLHPILISYFIDGEGDTNLTMQISHDEAVSKERIYVDDQRQIMLSDYRPGNLFWDTKYGNQKQQTLTYQEYAMEADAEFYRRHPEFRL